MRKTFPCYNNFMILLSLARIKTEDIINNKNTTDISSIHNVRIMSLDANLTLAEKSLNTLIFLIAEFHCLTNNGIQK